jgi:hypothetical protein
MQSKIIGGLFATGTEKCGESTIIWLSFADDNQKRIEEINSPFNVWVTGVNIDRSPNRSDCAWHWICYGGLENFRRNFRIIPVTVDKIELAA